VEGSVAEPRSPSGRAFRAGCALFCALLLIGAARSAVADGEPPRPVGGRLDLRSWQPDADGPIRLDGAWSYAPGRLLPPDAGRQAFGGVETRVPSNWGSEVTPQGARSGHGFASYGLELALPENAGPLALRLSTIGTAYRLYADGELVAGAGRVGTSADGAEAAYQPAIVRLPDPSGRRLQLVFHVANFDFARGGLWESIWIGRPDPLLADREAVVGLAMFLGGAFLILGLYHLTVWGTRRRDRSPLWFAVLCLAMAVRGLAVDDVHLLDLAPWLGWEGLVRAEFLSMMVALASVTLFMGSLFPRELPRRLIVGATACSGVAIASIVVLPVDAFSRGLPAMQAMVLTATAVGPALIALAWRRGREGSLLFLVGLAAISLAAIHDVAISNLRSLPFLKRLGGPYYLQSLGFLVFALCQSAVLALRASRTVEALERTGAELRAMRDELEQRVAERTAELEEANHELQRLAQDDGLTRLANRRRFDERLVEAWHDHARRRAPLALVLADIDRFKDFNDGYGHPAGDAALRRVAQSSAACARSPLDLVARYGGEELVTLLPDTDVEGAVRFAERQRVAVISLEIPHRDNDPGILTLSLGVASCVPRVDVHPESLIERADAALYEAKRMGRNQVVAEPPTGEPRTR